MRDKRLQDVVTELKTRGIRAGKAKAAKMVEAAEQQASEIVAAAEAQATQIVNDAKRRSEVLAKELDAELRQASAAGLEAFRQAVLKSMLVPAVTAELRHSLSDPSTLAMIITTAAQGIGASSSSDQPLEVLLPEAQREALGAAFVAKLKEQMRTGVKVRFDTGFEFGFQISPEASNYVFDFSEAGLRDVFVRYLSPRIREAFFDTR